MLERTLTLAFVFAGVFAACAPGQEVACEGVDCEAIECAVLDDGEACDLESSAGYCRLGLCEAAVSLLGRVVAHDTGLAITGGTVSALDQEAFAEESTGSDGRFELKVQAGDEDLVLQIEAGPDYPIHLSRSLAVGDDDYELNRDQDEPTFVFSSEFIEFLLDQAGLASGPQTAIAVRVGSDAGDPLGFGRVELEPPSGKTIYFGELREPDPTRNATSGASGLALIVGVAPGRYTLSATQRDATACLSAGSDARPTADIAVSSGAVTNAGWLVCSQ